MIRVLFGSALPVLGVGIAAAFFAPDLLTRPGGEPLIMASHEASLQAATFDGSACPSTMLFAGSPNGGGESGFVGARIVAFALGAGDGDVAVTVQEIPGAGGKISKTIVLVFDHAGRLVAAGDSASLHLPYGDTFSDDCPPDAAAPI